MKQNSDYPVWFLWDLIILQLWKKAHKKNRKQTCQENVKQITKNLWCKLRIEIERKINFHKEAIWCVS